MSSAAADINVCLTGFLSPIAEETMFSFLLHFLKNNDLKIIFDGTLTQETNGLSVISFLFTHKHVLAPCVIVRAVR